MIKSIKKFFQNISGQNLARFWPGLDGIWPGSGQILAQTGLMEVKETNFTHSSNRTLVSATSF
jgi:hypothetical protein